MNLPNKLSLLRMVIVPVIVCVSLFADFGNAFTMTYKSDIYMISYAEIIVIVLFCFASFTDFLDGNIARKRNLVTSFGKFIDPIADKLLVNTMLMLFAFNGQISIIPVLVMIWRDMIVDGLRMSASSKGTVVAAGILGKLKTVVQMAAIVVVLLNNFPFIYIGIPMDQILIWGAMIISVLSGLNYFMKLKNVVMETM